MRDQPLGYPRIICTIDPLGSHRLLFTFYEGMKQNLNIYLFYFIFGAIGGLVWASGILGFFDTRSTQNSSHWEPITKEEYRAGFVRDPLVGAGLGFIFATYTCIRKKKH